MTVSHVTENAPKYNAVQWTGSNVAEVNAFLNTAYIAALYADFYGMLLLFPTGDVIPVLEDRLTSGTWIVSAPYWGPQDDNLHLPYKLVSDYAYQQGRFTAIP